MHASAALFKHVQGVLHASDYTTWNMNECNECNVPASIIIHNTADAGRLPWNVNCGPFGLGAAVKHVTGGCAKCSQRATVNTSGVKWVDHYGN